METEAKVAWAATLRAATIRGHGQRVHDNRLVLEREDLRFRLRSGPSGGLLLFVIDASGSMTAWRRMRETKSAVLSLVLQAYRRRDRLAMLTFRGSGAELVLPPTPSLRNARRILETLPAGG